ncbi:MAG: alpha/beta hydrolase family protein [Burkholderiales bacterium]
MINPVGSGLRFACLALWLALACTARAAALDTALHEEIVSVPLPAGLPHAALVATIYRPDGAGPFPLLVLSHGNPRNAAARAKMGRYRVLSRIREFTRRGFVVIVPMRRGFGATGGSWAERYGDCAAPDFQTAGLEAAADLLATLAFARNLSYVDRRRIVLLGQSAGGFASIAAASRAPEGVLAVVNLSGGRGGSPSREGDSCSPEVMAETMARFARTIRVPVLWHYAENDRYFGPAHVRAWFAAFEAAGARGRLVMQPPFGKDGHRMFASPDGLPIWTAEFDRFLQDTGFPLK